MNQKIEVGNRVEVTAVASILEGRQGAVVAIRLGGRYPVSVLLDGQEAGDTPVAFARDELKVLFPDRAIETLTGLVMEDMRP